MKSFGIAIMDNVNVPRLIELLSKLSSLGCSITIEGANFKVEYEDNLEEDVKNLFDQDYKNNL